MPKGRMIYCSNIRETSHPIPGAWWSRYTYDADFAFLIRDHWTVALNRISYEGAVLYEALDPEHSSGSLTGYFKFYNGQQTKADPTLDAALEGNAPIYRNHSYVVFTEVPLILFCDRIPMELDFGLIEYRAVHLHADSTASNSAE